MPGSVNVVHPSTGRVVAVEPEKAHLYERLGYHVETQDEAVGRGSAEAKRAYYESPGEVGSTVIEGALSGATLGLSDVLNDDGDASSRAEYNPGARLGGELLGAVGGAFIPVLPAGLAAKAGAGITKAAGGGRLAQAAGIGTEAALGGAGTVAGHARLQGDPLTAESIAAGAGLGFFLGAGAGALGGVAVRAGQKARARLAEAGAEGLEGVVAKRAAIREQLAARATAKAEREVAEAEAEAATSAMRSSPYESIVPEAKWAAAKQDIGTVVDDLAAVKDTVDNIAGTVTDQNYNKLAQAETKKVIKNFASLPAEQAEPFAKGVQELRRTAAALERDPSNIGVIIAHERALAKASEDLGVPVATLPQAYSPAARKVMQEAEEAWMAADVLGSFPKTVGGFGNMTTDELVSLANAAETAKSMAGKAGPRMTRAADALEDILAHNGLSGPEPLADRLLELRKAVNKARPEAVAARGRVRSKQEALETHKLRSEEARLAAEEKALRGKLTSAGAFGASATMLRYTMGTLTAKAGKAVGGTVGGTVGFGLGAVLANSLMGVKNGVLDIVRRGVARFGEPVGKGIQRLGAANARLLFAGSLTGDNDDEAPNDIVKAAKLRIDEVASAAPVVEDVAMAAVTGIRADHPEVAAEIAKSIVTAVKYLVEVMPRDPGTVVMRGVSVWEPSPVQARDFGERYHAVTQPMAAMQAYIEGRLSPVAVHALANAWPAVHEYARQMALKLLPSILPTMDKSMRTRASYLLGVGLDGTQAPSFVKFLQQNLASAPMDGPGGVPPPGSSPGAGRPPGPEDEALTIVDRITNG